MKGNERGVGKEKRDECLGHVKRKVFVTCKNLKLHARLSVWKLHHAHI